jgi:8-oxo-dGTP pyrophosphatase MutT (NUDIX family)
MPDPVPARPAATVLLLRDGAEGLEVFMVARDRRIEFASGALVFPGGAVEPGDFAIAADPAQGGPGAPAESNARALRVAALRETFEECGVLLARPRGAAGMIDGARCAAARAAAAGRSFADLLAAETLALATDALTPFAHWITPPIMSKRFDTHFFLAAAPADQIALHDGAESVASLWITPARALAGAQAGAFTIVLPTRLNLAMLGRQRDVAAALAAAQARRIVTVEPATTKTPTGWALTLPVEAGYGGGPFEV